MHELGIAFHIIKEVDRFAEERHIDAVKGVTLEIGEVSGVIPSYLKDVWVWTCENRSNHMKGCKLTILEMKAISYCEDCKETYDTVKTGRTCPRCQGANTYLVEGDQITIHSIAVEEENTNGEAAA